LTVLGPESWEISLIISATEVRRPFMGFLVDENASTQMG
jgi:hypothetical protein